MTDVEKKLAEYRAKKGLNSPKSNTTYSKNLLLFFTRNKSDKEEEKNLNEKLIDEPKTPELSIPEDEDADESSDCCSYMDIVYYTLCLMLWATLWAIFIKIQFGTVYLVVSALIAIYINTRTRPKKKGEISAYSVFNKNCESIDGTLKAEQFEREIRYGPVSVK